MGGEGSLTDTSSYKYLCQNLLQIIQYPLVGNPQHTITQCLQFTLPIPVLRHLLLVNTTIQFNKQSSLIAAEIRHIRRAHNRMLTPKLQAARPAVSQFLPQYLLCRSLSLA